jgi:integrase
VAAPCRIQWPRYAEFGGLLVPKYAHIEQLTTAAISEFISNKILRQGIAPKTANRYREILMRLVSWAASQRGVHMPGDRNPARKVERYRERASQIRFLTLRQIDEQLELLKDDVQLQTMVALYIYAGLRREEALWLVFAEDDDMVQTLVPDTTVKSL